MCNSTIAFVSTKAISTVCLRYSTGIKIMLQGNENILSESMLNLVVIVPQDC